MRVDLDGTREGEETRLDDSIEQIQHVFYTSFLHFRVNTSKEEIETNE